MNSSNHEKVFKTLKQLRKEHNFSSKDMAIKLGISKAFYSQIENRNRRLSYEMAIKISKIFNSKPDKIFYKDFKIV